MKLDDLKNLQLTKEQQQMLVLGIVVLVGGAYSYVNLLYKPRLQRIVSLKEELKAEQTLLKEMEDSTRNIANFRREAEKTVRDLRRIKRRLPDEEKISEAMRGINKAVKMSGVTLQGFFKPPSRRGKGARGGENYSALITQIHIVSDYKGVATFITELMRVPRLLVCESVKLAQNRNRSVPGSIKAELSIKTYVYTGGKAKGKR